MDQKPFVPLRKPRTVVSGDLPPDLMNFYARNEGVGLESSPDRIVRLCRLDEVVRVTCSEIPIFGGTTYPGWEEFQGFRIGISMFLDEIYRVEHAPCCPPGSILTIGYDLFGPGGGGADVLEPSLVLAANFADWIAHLERCDWFEYGFTPGDVQEMAGPEGAYLSAHYQALNPEITWAQGR